MDCAKEAPALLLLLLWDGATLLPLPSSGEVLGGEGRTGWGASSSAWAIMTCEV